MPFLGRKNWTEDNISFLKRVERDLRSFGVLSPEAEAGMLIRHYGRLEKLELFTGDKRLSGSAKAAIRRALQKRRRSVPLAYVTKTAPFWGHDFHVEEGVLIPRPETERLVEEVLKVLEAHFDGQKPEILDLGTGSGCIAVCLTLEWPACKMTALDASSRALGIARKNIKHFGLSQKIRLAESRLFESFGNKKALWDIIVSNPPYVPSKDLDRLPEDVHHEPALALDGGAGGLEVVEAILAQAPDYLKPKGYLLMEIGKGQSKRIASQLAKRTEYRRFGFEKDLNGIERILVAQVHG